MDELTQERAALRESLLHGEAARALAESGCDRELAPLFALAIEQRLTVIEDEADGSVRVVGIDPATGRVRNGPRGPMTAAEVVAAYRAANPQHGKHWRR